MDLGLNVTNRDGHAVLSLRGEIDLATAPRFREQLIELVNGGERQIIVDLDQVDFLDSTGLGVLVGGLKRLRSHDGDLDIVCSNRSILRVLEVTGLTQVFAIYDSVDGAIAAGTVGASS